MDRKVILVVDDEEEIQELIKEYLSHLNVEIYSAYDGGEAVRIYKELWEKGRKPDLVVMDLNLSESKCKNRKQLKEEQIDGVKTTQKLKRIDPNANVIGFTAYAHLDWGERLRKIGVKHVFGREIGFNGFAEKVRKLLSLS